MRYLILGAAGQLGSEFVRRFSEASLDFYALTRAELDISSLNDVITILREFKPQIVINCSAYNEVDKAEGEGFDEALRVNAFGPRNLALAVRELGALLIHYSTDYVFSGEKGEPYGEEDLPSPINRYGLSKFLGEREIASILEEERYLIFRVSWVYGKGKRNFLYKLLSWAQTREVLRVACDEFSVPTSTKLIVDFTLKALKKELRGPYHLVASDYTSRFEWARAFFNLKGIKKRILPAYQADFELPAKRPLFSALSNEKLSKALSLEIPHWKEALTTFAKASP